MPGDTLPPVIAVLSGNADDFDVAVDHVEEKLLGLDAESTDVRIGANIDDFEEKAAVVQAEMDALDAEGGLSALGMQFTDVEQGVHDLDTALEAMDLTLADFMGGTITADEALQNIEMTGIDTTQMLDDVGLGFQDVEQTVAAATQAISDAELAIGDLEQTLLTGEGALQDFEASLNAAGGGAGSFELALASMAEAGSSAISSLSGMSIVVGLIGGAAISAVPVIGALVGALGALTAIGFTAFAGLGAFMVAAVPVFMSVTTAYQQIAADQLRITQASTAATKATANAALTQYLASLNPMVRDLAQGVLYAKTAFENWDAQFQPDIMRVFNAALADMQPLLSAITPLVHAGAGAFESIFKSLGADFSDPSFKGFITWLVVNLQPAVDSIMGFVTNVSIALQEMAEAGGPFISKMEQGINSFGQDLANFGKSNTFKDFVKWLDTNGPIIGHDIETIGKSIGKIATELAPLGMDLLGFFTQFMNGLANVIPSITNWGHEVQHVFDDLSAEAGRVVQDVENWFNNMVAFFTAIPGQVDHVWGDVVSAIHAAWSSVANWVKSNVIDPVVNFFRGLSSAVSGAIAGIAGIIEAPFQAAESVIMAIIHAIEAAIGGISSAIGGVMSVVSGAASAISGLSHAAGAVGGFLSHPFGLASGGIVSSPTFAMIGEGGEREAVVPESKWGAFGAAVSGGGGGGVSVGQIVINGANASPNEIAMAVREELLNLGRSTGGGGLFGRY